MILDERICKNNKSDILTAASELMSHIYYLDAHNTIHLLRIDFNEYISIIIKSQAELCDLLIILEIVNRDTNIHGLDSTYCLTLDDISDDYRYNKRTSEISKKIFNKIEFYFDIFVKLKSMQNIDTVNIRTIQLSNTIKDNPDELCDIDDGSTFIHETIIDFIKNNNTDNIINCRFYFIISKDITLDLSIICEKSVEIINEYAIYIKNNKGSFSLEELGIPGECLGCQIYIDSCMDYKYMDTIMTDIDKYKYDIDNLYNNIELNAKIRDCTSFISEMYIKLGDIPPQLSITYDSI